MTILDRSDYSHIFGYLEEEGGNNNAVGDYSSTSGEFVLQPPAGATWGLDQIIISIHGACGRSGYGSELPLANGITVKTTDSEGEMIKNITNGVPIKDEVMWGSVCGQVRHNDTGEDLTWVFATWDFIPIVLKDQGRYVITLNDDMRHLTEHRFRAQGAIANYLYKPPE